MTSCSRGVTQCVTNSTDRLRECVTKGGGGPKYWKFCVMSFMDGPYCLIGRLNIPDFPRMPDKHHTEQTTHLSEAFVLLMCYYLCTGLSNRAKLSLYVAGSSHLPTLYCQRYPAFTLSQQQPCFLVARLATRQELPIPTSNFLYNSSLGHTLWIFSC